MSDEIQRVKIVSDGTSHRTRIEVDGKPLDNVTAFTITSEAPDPVRVTLELFDVEVEIDGDFERVTEEYVGQPRYDPALITKGSQAHPNTRIEP